MAPLLAQHSPHLNGGRSFVRDAGCHTVIVLSLSLVREKASSEYGLRLRREEPAPFPVWQKARTRDRLPALRPARLNPRDLSRIVMDGSLALRRAQKSE